MLTRNFAPGEEKVTGTTTTVVNTEKGAEEKHEESIPYARFAEVNQQKATAEKEKAGLQAQLDKIAADKKTADEKALAEQGKYKELADAKDAELKTLADQVVSAKITNDVLKAAATAGAIDPDAVVALLDYSKVEVGADGKVTGAKEAVDELLKAKPYLAAQTGSGYRMGAGGGNISNPSAAEVDGMTPEQYRAWRKAHPDA